MYLERVLNSFLIPLIIIFLSIIFAQNLFLGGSHFSHLAASFLQQKLYFLTQPDNTWIDTSFFSGHYYWPAGFFPALVVLPFVAMFQMFGLFFYQGYIQPILVVGVFIIVYKIAKKTGFSHTDCLFWAYGFCFSTVFLNVALWPAAWGFAQVVTVLLMWLVIYGYVRAWPLPVLGLFSGMAGASRFAASGIFFFYVLSILFIKKAPVLSIIRQLISFSAPFIFMLFIIGLYNFARFGNFFENGYTYQILTNENLEKARSYGLFNLMHLPGNLYYFFISTPLPVFKSSDLHVLSFPFIRANPWGMSVFVTSPVLIKLFFTKIKDRLSVIILFTALVIAIPIFLYYGIGWRQAGYRYSLDFLPLLFWLLMKNYSDDKKLLSPGFKVIILISSILNFHLVLTAFLYP